MKNFSVRFMENTRYNPVLRTVTVSTNSLRNAEIIVAKQFDSVKIDAKKEPYPANKKVTIQSIMEI